MLKSAALLLAVLTFAPAFAQEGARTDVAALKKLAAEAVALCSRGPAELALSVVQPDLTTEVAQVLHAHPAPRLKVAPR